jgi:predicted AAA+ superfamily ATPase
MRRDRTAFLIEWLHSSTRKPLVIRGARQVGKTWLIRDLAASQQKRLIELNFEKRPDLVTLFSSNDPQEILINIGTTVGQKIEPRHAILFLDEIQAAPHLLEKLRWFAEDLPELPVLAAGSLLDFALAAHEFSMPVGRIGYLYLEPLSFEEFLDAVGMHELRSYLFNYKIQSKIPSAIHSQLTKLTREYLIIGGMPAAVLSWITQRNPLAVNQIHFDLLATYRDDFAKYNGRLTIERLEEVMSAIPRQLGRKFVYRNANSAVATPALKQALDLLCKARICHRIVSTAANGLPLDAEADEKYSKVILLDCGLCSASLGLSLHQMVELSEIGLVNNGGMAEQLAGQLLRTTFPAYVPPALYYWHRKKRDAVAEVDYIIQHENQVLPLEVKAGSTGTLKSLQQFMLEKKRPIAVRINSDFPSLCTVKITPPSGEIDYQLLSVPFYLIGQLRRLLNDC